VFGFGINEFFCGGMIDGFLVRVLFSWFALGIRVCECWFIYFVFRVARVFFCNTGLICSWLSLLLGFLSSRSVFVLTTVSKDKVFLCCLRANLSGNK